MEKGNFDFTSFFTTVLATSARQLASQRGFFSPVYSVLLSQERERKREIVIVVGSVASKTIFVTSNSLANETSYSFEYTSLSEYCTREWASNVEQIITARVCGDNASGMA